MGTIMLNGTGYGIDQTAINRMETAIDNNTKMIADQYITTKTYNVGDKAIHDGKLYKCIASTSGTWTANKWQEAKSAVTNWGDITGTLSNQTDLNTALGGLQSQIDNFTQLPTGSTSADAELMNIRVGYNNTNYSTAGDAVRGQVTDLHTITDGHTTQLNAMKTGFDGVEYDSPADAVVGTDLEIISSVDNHNEGIIDLGTWKSGRIDNNGDYMTDATTIRTDRILVYSGMFFVDLGAYNGNIYLLDFASHAIIVSKMQKNKTGKISVYAESKCWLLIVLNNTSSTSAGSDISVEYLPTIKNDLAYLRSQVQGVEIQTTANPNLFDGLYIRRYISAGSTTQGLVENQNYPNFIISKNYNPIEANKKYYCDLPKQATDGAWLFFYNSSKTYISNIALSAKSTVFTSPENAAYWMVELRNNNGISDKDCDPVFVGEKSGNSEFANKLIDFWGDSRTWYDGNAYEYRVKSEWYNKICVGYQQTVKAITGCSYVSHGYSGQNSIYICNQIRNYDFSNDDIIVLDGGINDREFTPSEVGTIAAIGSTFDTNTSYGAWQSAVEYILTNYPDKSLILTTPFPCYNGDGTISISQDIAYIKKNVSELYNLPCFNAYKFAGINIVNGDHFYADDGFYLHLNDYGNAFFGKRLAGYIIATR